MARTGKNDNNLKDTAREQEGHRPTKPSKNKKEAAADCGHSIGLRPHLIGETPSLEPKAMATDNLTVLRRLYKKEFGYKPVGKSIHEIEQILQGRGVDPWG